MITTKFKFPGTFAQLDQLMMRTGLSGGWLRFSVSSNKVFDFLNGARLVWRPRSKTITLIGDARSVGYVETRLKNLMKQFGFTSDPEHLLALLQSLSLALSAPSVMRSPRIAGTDLALAAAKAAPVQRTKRRPANRVQAKGYKSYTFKATK